MNRNQGSILPFGTGITQIGSDLFPLVGTVPAGLTMTTMNSGRLKTIAISLVLLVVVGAASMYIATEYGTSRAITVLVAVALVAGLTWLVLMIVSILTATSARRERADDAWKEKDEQLRPIERRTIILPEERRNPGRRRKNPDA